MMSSPYSKSSSPCHRLLVREFIEEARFHDLQGQHLSSPPQRRNRFIHPNLLSQYLELAFLSISEPMSRALPRQIFWLSKQSPDQSKPTVWRLVLQVAASVSGSCWGGLVFLLLVLVKTEHVVFHPGPHTILEMNTTHQSNTPEPRIHTLTRTVPTA